MAVDMFLKVKDIDGESKDHTHRGEIEVLSWSYPDDYPEPEAIYILKRKGLRIKEVPVAMESRAAGRSSITFWHSLYYMVKVCLAIFVLLLRKDE